MAETSNEEMLNDPTIAQAEHLPTETSSIKDENIITPKQETANMEVHHHPDLHHKPKKWREYFIEFLMIFLAVTLGFFAENIREHQVEKKVENALIRSLVDDLKADTAAFLRRMPAFGQPV